MDPYQALISGTPDDEVLQQHLAKGLRRDADFGVLGMVSGDAALSPVGRGLITQSNNRAAKMGDNLRSQKKQRALQGYYDAMENQMSGATQNAKDRLDLDTTRADNDHEYKMIMGMAAMIRALKSGGSGSGSGGDDFKKLRSSDISALHQKGNVTDSLNSLLTQAKDPELAVGNMALPGMRTVGNFMAQYGIGNESSKNTQDWWANYDKFYTLEMRNLLFGATLTTNEQRAWKGANISPEMTQDQIEHKLEDLFNVLMERNATLADAYVTEGYNPDSVYGFMGQPVPEETQDAGGLYQQDGPQQLIPPSPESAKALGIGGGLPEGITIKVK